MTAVFEFAHVTKCYGAVMGLQDVSLRLPVNHHTAVLGPSGGGKSTLLRLLAGLEPPTSGTITLNGQPASVANRILVPPHDRGVAMVFQDLALWPNLTVCQNVRLGLSGLRVHRQQLADRVHEALERCGIGELADRYPAQLSGGQQQRAALARALAVSPQVLLLDEPFSGVDLHTKSHILSEIARLSDVQQFKVILVSHDPGEALFLCTHTIVVDSGTVRATGNTRDLVSTMFAANHLNPFGSDRPAEPIDSEQRLPCNFPKS